MAILANIAVSDSFLTSSLVRMNQIIAIANEIKERNLISNGTMTIVNVNKSQGNISLNVASGLIKGDGGLISNVRSSSLTTIPNSKLQNTTINILSNSPSLNISGSPVPLGNTINLSLISTNSVSDLSNTNLAVAFAVTKTYNLANSANILANNAYSLGLNANNIATDSYTIAIAAFNKANTGGSNTLNTLIVSGNSYFGGTIDTASANIKSQILVDGANIAWNLASGQVATVILGGVRNMSAPTFLRVGTYILHVYNDSSGGRGIATWNSIYKWPGGVVPPISSSPNSHDVVTFVSDGTNMYGSYILDVK